jgi:hypothetical protein
MYKTLRFRGLNCYFKVLYSRIRGWDGRTYSADQFRVFEHGQDRTGFPTCREVNGIIPVNPKLFGRD